MPRIRPLTGQSLIELLPPDQQERGIFLPDIAQDSRNSPDDPYRRKQAVKGKVVEMGAWPKTDKGFAVPPAFGIGATVFLSAYVGTPLDWDTTGKLRLVKNGDVLAVLA